MSLASYFQSAAANSKSGSPLSRYTDIALVAGIVAIIALMIVPLPNWAIDILVAVNISGGILLLLLAIYISSPLEFSVFPSVLLISTLFRLALSIATTRMILLHGEAGHIIQTFGDMVAGGNLVVGLVCFSSSRWCSSLSLPKVRNAWLKWLHVFHWTPCLASKCPSIPICVQA